MKSAITATAGSLVERGKGRQYTQGFSVFPHFCRGFAAISFEWFSSSSCLPPTCTKNTSIFIAVIYVAHKGWLKGKVTPEFLHNLFDCVEPRGTNRPPHTFAAT